MIDTVFRVRRPDLDFSEFRAKEGRHKIHDYPAMLHYKVVEYLLKEFGQESAVLYDPFCGSGVSLVEGLKQNKNVIGTDINPLALLISDVRTQNFTVEELENTFLTIRKMFLESEPDIPKVKNIEYWFKENVIGDLGKLRNVLKSFMNTTTFKFFLVVFSQTVRNVSNNRKGEFKRYRIEPSKLSNYNPNVWDEFEKIFNEYVESYKGNFLPEKNTRKLLLMDVRKHLDFSADIVITSPPYGDSRTTVAYGEFSSFSLEWLKDLNPYGNAEMDIDKLSLGGNNLKESISQKISSYVKELIGLLSQIDEKRAKNVLAYFDDLFLACQNIAQVVNKNGTIIFVVGNRKVKGIQIQTDLAVKEFFEYLGCRHLNTFVRKISNKRMPIANCPTNKVGQVQETMSEEFIVVMRKEN
jgi:DNA modification methylase